jgi:NAD(P)-dependent dehydrogenase (short-subunit alcohol dehydrogenase family)
MSGRLGCRPLVIAYLPGGAPKQRRCLRGDDPRSNLAATVPLKVGWLQPDDISPAAVFLASDAAAMVTGAEYEVTGGDSAKDI